MATPTAIVAYLALFAAVAGIFLFVNLLVGRLARPNTPNDEKLEVYECGEPVIGSSFVQFDLRFYVVALLFIIFDVEIAFFFPWATVFGKATELTAPARVSVSAEAEDQGIPPAMGIRLQELGLSKSNVADLAAVEAPVEAIRATARKVALTSFADIGVFFAVLLVGFAYVWKRGDLDWVRSVASQRGEVVERGPPREAGTVAKPAGSILST